MRSLSNFLLGIAAALYATAASAQDLAIDVDQSFTAHPERFGLSAAPQLEKQAVSVLEQTSAPAATETPPVGEDARQEARDQGNGEAIPWDDQERREAEPEH